MVYNDVIRTIFLFEGYLTNFYDSRSVKKGYNMLLLESVDMFKVYI